MQKPQLPTWFSAADGSSSSSKFPPRVTLQVARPPGSSTSSSRSRPRQVAGVSYDLPLSAKRFYRAAGAQSCSLNRLCSRVNLSLQHHHVAQSAAVLYAAGL
jgi:hypothetical protein